MGQFYNRVFQKLPLIVEAAVEDIVGYGPWL
jgi:hypothetical protein